MIDLNNLMQAYINPDVSTAAPLPHTTVSGLQVQRNLEAVLRGTPRAPSGPFTQQAEIEKVRRLEGENASLLRRLEHMYSTYDRDRNQAVRIINKLRARVQTMREQRTPEPKRVLPEGIKPAISGLLTIR